jgi:hypothetical protein
MTAWEALSHKDRPYVKVSPSERAKSEGEVPEEMRSLAVYYAAAGGSLVVTMNEALLRRALDRQIQLKESRPAGEAAAAGETPAPPGRADPWLGKSLALRAERKAIDLIAFLGRDEYRRASQNKSWDNLPILNEWKRLYPREDPIQLHERLWGTRLLCPGGGTYVWSEEWRTMESTVHGHPARPKDGPEVPLSFSKVGSAAFGLTFEKQGLRARAEIERGDGRR